jgi:hypothetical protein
VIKIVTAAGSDIRQRVGPFGGSFGGTEIGRIPTKPVCQSHNARFASETSSVRTAYATVEANFVTLRP